MKSSLSNTYKLSWNSNVRDLYSKGPSASAQSLIDSGISTLQSLLWIIPLRAQAKPVTKNFFQAYEDSLFTGVGRVISVRSLPNFQGRGKNGAQLLNITAIVKDHLSSGTIELKWFNAYPSLAQKVQKLLFIKFSGKIQHYGESKQIINPDFESQLEETLPDSEEKDEKLPTIKVQYPTINGVSSSNIKKIIDKIPIELWRAIEETTPIDILKMRGLLPLQNAFHLVHGKVSLLEEWSDLLYKSAKERLIYEEFLDEQFKIHLRRKVNLSPKGIVTDIDEESFKKYTSIYPYKLTEGQITAIEDIMKDMASGRPMMRLLQGDVGCGKTSVAISIGMMVIKAGYQVVLMCPTESLANQHYSEIKDYCSSVGISTSLLTGSLNSKVKKQVLEDCKKGNVQFIIGTHALIQSSVEFKNLGLSIIDEQHKFGVEQRLSLVKKGLGSHCLIMSATPIPRSLSLTQFGDLSISTITSIPSGRKGTKTRIVQPENFVKFLSFIKTRVEMNEQVYIVVPAITESPKQDILNLEDVHRKFLTFFPDFCIEGLHGQLNSTEKNSIINRFKAKEVNILIATSVIEVGINVLNATIMAIMSPERFGLSSLHQLRGRVGRGEKPGFCFLVIDNKVSQDSLNRLQVIEDNTDGFKIAEEDLKIRGSGDIFGKDQSGSAINRKIANIITDFEILEQAREDSIEILKRNTPETQLKMEQLAKDAKVFSTV